MMAEVDVDKPCTTILVSPSPSEILLLNRRTTRDLKLAPVAIFETCKRLTTSAFALKYVIFVATQTPTTHASFGKSNDSGPNFEICHLSNNPETIDTVTLCLGNPHGRFIMSSGRKR